MLQNSKNIFQTGPSNQQSKTLGENIECSWRPYRTRSFTHTPIRPDSITLIMTLSIRRPPYFAGNRTNRDMQYRNKISEWTRDLWRAFHEQVRHSLAKAACRSEMQYVNCKVSFYVGCGCICAIIVCYYVCLRLEWVICVNSERI